MGYRVTLQRLDTILDALRGEYRIFGPCMNRRTGKVRFSEFRSCSQLVTDRQSDFSPKEIYYPISQVMYYFRDGEVQEYEPEDVRPMLIFAHACDINAIRRLDSVFLKNGGQADAFYARLRERVRFVLLECPHSFEHCFCVSMGTNRTEDYCMALRMTGDGALIEVRDKDFQGWLEGEEQAEYAVSFISENEKKLRFPDIHAENIKAISQLDFWSQFDEKCIACGGCNTVCGTCSCFDTVDTRYTQGSSDGERRRVWSSCMLRDFTLTAGGGLSRKTQGANMRFKVFHKFYDYKARFNDGNMCVGCGRCDLRCPQGISFFDTVCALHDKLAAEEEGEGK